MTTSPALIEVQGLEKTYRGAHKRALCGVDLTIHEGEFCALLGPNGAGKTTLISILCGVLSPGAGKVALRATDGSWHTPREARRFIGIVPQNLAFYPTLTVQENLRYFAAMQGLAGAALAEGMARALEAGRLAPMRDQHAETLSGGMKRRLNFAIGIAHAPRLLILDEPTAGVDAQSRGLLREELARLNSEGVTIIYTSHYLDEVEQICDTVAVIDHGQVIARGRMQELLREDVVRLGFEASPPENFLARLAAIDSVSAVQHDRLQVILQTSDPRHTLSETLAAAQAAQLHIARASIGYRDLESLFFQLTGKGLREGDAEEGARAA